MFRNYAPHDEELKQYVVSRDERDSPRGLIFWCSASQKPPPEIPDLEKELVELCLDQVKVDEAAREVLSQSTRTQHGPCPRPK